MHARSLLLVVSLTAALASIPRIAAATPPGCGRLTIDDPLTGATVGAQQGGTLDAAGFTPGDPPGSIVWDLPSPLRQGCVEVTVEGLQTVGVGEHDLLELFTGPAGSFTDGATDHFLLLKIAGDVFPGYEGRLKVEMGLEYDTLEVGTWAEPLPWSAAESHTLAVRLDGTGIAEFYRDDVLLETVDYNEIEGGELAFASLRIPNDGEYQVDPLLNGARYRDVRVYDADPGGGDDTTTGEPETDGGEPDTSGGPGPADDTATSGAGTGVASTGEGVSTGDPGPISGLPPPPQQGGETGCACTTASPSAGGTAAWLLAPLLLLGYRRSRASRSISAAAALVRITRA